MLAELAGKCGPAMLAHGNYTVASAAPGKEFGCQNQPVKPFKPTFIVSIRYSQETAV